MLTNIIVSVVVFMVFCIIATRIKTRTEIKIVIAMIGGIIGLSILVYPLLDYDNKVLHAANAFYYATKSIGFNQDLDIFSKIDMATNEGKAHFIVLNVFFVALPVMTASVIISLLSNVFGIFKNLTLKRNNICVFSEVNEKSLLVAKEVKKRVKSKIVFASVKDNDIIDVKSVKMNKKITDLKFGKKNNATIYMISENRENNLNDALEFIDNNKNKINKKVYVVNNSADAPIILDSTEKGNLLVELINEKERAILNLLDTTPLYLNSINDTISILIVGCGDVGSEFLKNAVWCGMMIGYRLKITVIDINADIIKEHINMDAPELLINYDIKFIKADIKTLEAVDAIKAVRDINYILVAMENDNKNLDTAIYLRKLFIHLYNRKPVINLWIENNYKQEQIDRLENKILKDRNISYEINAFGSIEDMYYGNRIIDSDIERMSKGIHLAYDPSDTEYKGYNRLEYNKRSSRANAVHIKYKLYSVLGENYSDDMRKNLELFNQIDTPELKEALAKNEHDRWNAYTRGIGYTLTSVYNTKEYYKYIGDYVNHIAKWHPALVKYSELDKVSEELNKFMSEPTDLRKKDIDLVSKIPVILKNYLNKK